MHKLLIIFFVIAKILNSVNAITDSCICNCDDCDNAIISINMYDADDGDSAATCEIKRQLELLQSANEDLLARIEALSARSSRYPSNCAEAVAVANSSKSGLYSIQFENMVNAQPFLVYCDQNIQGGSWTVIQRRLDGSVNFYRTWAEYKVGFGNLNGEFWIGLDKLHTLTTQSPQELLILMADFDGAKVYAKYASFAIGSENEAYALNVLGRFTGTAGDALSFHALSKFSAKDVDNDSRPRDSCAVQFEGAWWYGNCYTSNLNGKYLNGEYSTKENARGVVWNTFRGNHYSLKFVQMMIRPQRV